MSKLSYLEWLIIGLVVVLMTTMILAKYDEGKGDVMLRTKNNGHYVVQYHDSLWSLQPLEVEK